MSFYVSKTPNFIPFLFPKRKWHFDRTKKVVYLTFDDGPTDELTLWILETLKSYNAKATFFCVGDNVIRKSALIQRIVAENHSIGNHTQHHSNGFKTNVATYIKDTELFNDSLKNVANITTDIFRPPYGKMTSQQATNLLKKNYTIIMWDVLSGDFDASLSSEKCLHNVIKNTQNGSIIVFHDNKKSAEKLTFVLPKVLKYFTEKGFSFEAIRTVQPN